MGFKQAVISALALLSVVNAAPALDNLQARNGGYGVSHSSNKAPCCDVPKHCSWNGHCYGSVCYSSKGCASGLICNKGICSIKGCKQAPALYAKQHAPVGYGYQGQKSTGSGNYAAPAPAGYQHKPAPKPAAYSSKAAPKPVGYYSKTVTHPSVYSSKPLAPSSYKAHPVPPAGYQSYPAGYYSHPVVYSTSSGHHSVLPTVTKTATKTKTTTTNRATTTTTTVVTSTPFVLSVSNSVSGGLIKRKLVPNLSRGYLRVVNGLTYVVANAADATRFYTTSRGQLLGANLSPANAASSDIATGYGPFKFGSSGVTTTFRLSGGALSWTNAAFTRAGSRAQLIERTDNQSRQLYWLFKNVTPAFSFISLNVVAVPVNAVNPTSTLASTSTSASASSISSTSASSTSASTSASSTSTSTSASITSSSSSGSPTSSSSTSVSATSASSSTISNTSSSSVTSTVSTSSASSTTIVSTSSSIITSTTVGTTTATSSSIFTSTSTSAVTSTTTGTSVSSTTSTFTSTVTSNGSTSVTTGTTTSATTSTFTSTSTSAVTSVTTGTTTSAITSAFTSTTTSATTSVVTTTSVSSASSVSTTSSSSSASATATPGPRVQNAAALAWYDPVLTDGTTGYSNPSNYTCFNGSAANYPPRASWMNFNAMFERNRAAISSFPSNTPQIVQYIHDAIVQVSQDAQVDARVILAIVMQESTGNVAVPCTTNSATQYPAKNCGLMQAFNGSVSFDPNNAQASIIQMIRDGTQGPIQTSGQFTGQNAGGLVQIFSYSSSQQNVYNVARIYNSGNVNPDNLNDPLNGGSTASYVTDVANRLLGWDGSGTPFASCGSTGTAKPSPTQANIDPQCTKYYLPPAGQYCYDIAQANGITLEQFYRWNPDVGSSCQTLYAGYYVCVAAPN